MGVYKILDEIDATVSTTSEVTKLTKSYDWDITFVPTGLSKDFKITIETSPNGTDWATYKLDGQTITKDKNESIFDSLLVGDYFRVQYDDNGNTSGTLTAYLNVKYKS